MMAKTNEREPTDLAGAIKELAACIRIHGNTLRRIHPTALCDEVQTAVEKRLAKALALVGEE